jgi:predicted DNA-binding transcriptional regulator AlpA
MTTRPTPLIAIDEKQVAEAMNLSVAQVWRSVRNGELPEPKTFGKKKRWGVDQLSKLFTTETDQDNEDPESAIKERISQRLKDRQK